MNFKESKVIKQEIFSVGIWNGMKFELSDLEKIEKSFGELKDVLRIPLKLGHDDRQVLTDGLPAIGWVENVKLNRETEKLEAELRIVSDVVMKAIDMEMYQSVSIELDVGVTYKDKQFEFVLTGVALLGAELPAVNNLNDLGKFDRSLFTRKESLHFNLNLKQGDDMSDDIKALQEQIDKLTETIKLSKEESDQTKAENEKLKAQIAQKEEQEKEREFKFAKSTVETTLEKLVKANKILPKVREQFAADISEDNIQAKSEAAKMMFESLMGKNEKAFDDEEQAMNEDHDDTKVFSADQQLHLKAKEIQMDKNIPYKQALDFAKQTNPKLAQEWVDMDGFSSAA